MIGKTVVTDYADEVRESLIDELSKAGHIVVVNSGDPFVTVGGERVLMRVRERVIPLTGRREFVGTRTFSITVAAPGVTASGVRRTKTFTQRKNPIKLKKVVAAIEQALDWQKRITAVEKSSDQISQRIAGVLRGAGYQDVDILKVISGSSEVQVTVRLPVGTMDRFLEAHGL